MEEEAFYNGDEVNVIMASQLSLQPLPEFNPDAEVGASLAKKWDVWIRDFEMFIVASGVTENTQKRALLLYSVGSRVREIFDTLERDWSG